MWLSQIARIQAVVAAAVVVVAVVVAVLVTPVATSGRRGVAIWPNLVIVFI